MWMRWGIAMPNLYSTDESIWILERLTRPALQTALNDWEQGFVASVQRRVQKSLPLTIQQKVKIGQIWDRVGAKGGI